MAPSTATSQPWRWSGTPETQPRSPAGLLLMPHGGLDEEIDHLCWPSRNGCGVTSNMGDLRMSFADYELTPPAALVATSPGALHHASRPCGRATFRNKGI